MIQFYYQSLKSGSRWMINSSHFKGEPEDQIIRFPKLGCFLWVMVMQTCTEFWGAWDHLVHHSDKNVNVVPSKWTIMWFFKKKYDEVGAASGEYFWLGESINFFLSSTWTTGRRVVGMNFPQNWRISEAPTSWEMLNVEPRGGDSQSPAKTQFFFGVLLINGSGLKMCASQVVFKTVCFKTSPGRLMLISILCLYCWQLCWTRSALVTLTSQWTTIFYLIWGTLPNRRDHSCNWTFFEIS